MDFFQRLSEATTPSSFFHSGNLLEGDQRARRRRPGVVEAALGEDV